MESIQPSRTLVEQAYAIILEAICDRTLRPGERLTQEEIAARLNVSRQPVMHALATLKSQGFVQDSGKRGLVVAPIERTLFEAIYQFRSAVEPLAVRLATPRLTAKSIAKGRLLIARGKAAIHVPDPRAIVRADMDFHLLIYELSGNPLILDTMRLNWHHLRRSMDEVLRAPGMSVSVWEEHDAIFAAMVRGDADEAATLIEQHMRQAMKRVAPGLA
jgi:DNA-binding GntR family transcriptional regulator